jgi:hypothetical protein
MTRARILIPILILLIGGLAGAGWWYLAVGRFPLRGDLRHDFGVIDTYGSPVSVEHTFRLRNATSETLRIDRIIPSCGCTDVAASTMTIDPGGEVEIAVTLTVSGRQDKRWHKHIDLLLADHGVMTLWINADAKRVMHLAAAEEAIDLEAGGSADLVIYVEYFRTEDEPPAPTIESPDSVTARFVGWERADRSFAMRDSGTRWRGTVRVERDDEPLPSDAHVSIALSEAEPVRIAIRSPDVGPRRDGSGASPVSPSDRGEAAGRGR